MFDVVLARENRRMIEDFRRSFDQLFNGLLPSGPSWAGAESWSSVIESEFKDDTLVYRAVVPGFSEKDLRISVHEGALTIEGERKADEGEDKGHVRRYGKFYSRISLPSGVDFDKGSAQLKDGILQISFPVAESAKPRQIEIRSGEAKAITA